MILDEESEKDDFSDDFDFGLMKRGIFDGWPSGHAKGLVTRDRFFYSWEQGLRAAGLEPEEWT